MTPQKATKREQLGVRVSPEALELLVELQKYYAREARLPRMLSQSDAVERLIQDEAARLRLTPTRGGKRL